MAFDKADRDPRKESADSSAPPLPPGGPGRPTAKMGPSGGGAQMGGPPMGGPGGMGGLGGQPGGYGAMMGGMGPGGPGMGMGQPPMDPMMSAAIQLGMQADMLLKQLGQLVPLMGPWVQQVGEQLKVQLAQSMRGAGPPSMVASGAERFPDGSGRL